MVIAVGGAVTTLMWPRHHAEGPQTPAELAHRTCVLMRSVESDVQHNRSAQSVRHKLAVADDLATRASAGDQRWLSLAGAVQAMHVAIETDSPDAALIGVEVVNDVCGRVLSPH